MGKEWAQGEGGDGKNVIMFLELYLQIAWDLLKRKEKPPPKSMYFKINT